eukprot:TRINITY_DN7146_c0_g1_i1.p1 TRINITY_DN7146_c0_g1~~TRINITY_DN7146_c0_g1_i1.p1  ORF type:complete len:488 (-),score=91.50 TRINITY_DN7146_c0_g1_i1:336-1799(-)
MEAFAVGLTSGQPVHTTSRFSGRDAGLSQPAHGLQLPASLEDSETTQSATGSRFSAPLLTFGAVAILSAAQRRRKRVRHATATMSAEPVKLAAEDEWIAKLDIDGFGKEVRELGQRLGREQGQDDIRHLNKIINWSNFCALVGLATMWMPMSPISIMALSLWTHSRWTMIAHHCCHGGYNRTDESGRFSGKTFALGTLWRRCCDWLDWFLPEAWAAEHNDQHHMKLGEEADPDLVERNVADWGGFPKRLILTVVSLLTWKWSYYASNTYKELKLAELREKDQMASLPKDFDPLNPVTLSSMAKGEAKGLFSFGELFRKVVGPYLIGHFVLLPAPLLFFGTSFFWNAVTNLFLADLLTNLHAFLVIGSNHCGKDLYRFEQGCKAGSPTFYLRAVTSSVNFRTGGDLNDFFHGFLNYQIEHHAWPHLSMLAYRKGQPELKAICKKYGVPYVQENVFTRAKKTIDVMLGRAKMRLYPVALEHKVDMMAMA